MDIKALYRRFAPEFIKELRRNIKIKKQNKDNGRYQQWIRDNEKKVFDHQLDHNPKFSVIIPVYNVKKRYLKECMDSVKNGVYENYEICIADDASTLPEVRELLSEYEKDPKIKVVYRDKNGHISEATNSALELATGEFVVFMDCDDILSPDALFRVAKLLNKNRELDFIYSDEDKTDDKGRRSEPHFKPEYSPDTLMSYMYTSHLGVYRKSIIDELGGLRKGFEGAQDYDLTLRFVEKTDEKRIAHISKILYHWRKVKGSTAGNTEAKEYVINANKRATLEAMERRGAKGTVEYIDILHQFRPVYDPGDIMLSIIIPSKDNPDIWENCVRSVRNADIRLRCEIITVDNGSSDENRKKYETVCSELDIKYIYEKEKFNFSSMCNRGAEHAGGDVLLFLNDDTELVVPDAFYRMAGQAMLPHTGAVGAKLLYGDGKRIQHTGVLNIAPGPSHAFVCMDDDKNIPLRYGRNIADFNYLAVTGACLMIEKKKFDELSGFDISFPIAYNDVELCMRLEEAGYHQVVRNDAVLLHLESVSRGDDRLSVEKLDRLKRERQRLYDAHPGFKGYDPYYNKNLDQNNVNFTV